MAKWSYKKVTRVVLKVVEDSPPTPVIVIGKPCFETGWWKLPFFLPLHFQDDRAESNQTVL